MTTKDQKKLEQIEKQYGDKIENINDLTGGKEPSKLFYILAKHLDYLLDNDPDVCIKRYGVRFRKVINPIIKILAPSFMTRKQVFEDKDILMEPEKKDASKKHPQKIDLPKEPVIWIANHAFKDDVVATICACQRHSYILFGSVPQFFNTFDGVSAYINGVAMTNRKVKASRKASLDKAIKAMEYGADLMMFPEGVWNKSPNLPIIQLWPGVYRIAKQTGAKIVPIVHYTPDMLNKEKDNTIHTVIDDPIDISNLSETEALSLLRDKMATWHMLMMEKYGETTREKVIGQHTSSIEAWEEHLRERIQTTDRYDIEIETCADYRPRNITDPRDVWQQIADIENVDANTIKSVEYAKQLIKEQNKNDFQRRF